MMGALHKKGLIRLLLIIFFYSGTTDAVKWKKKDGVNTEINSLKDGRKAVTVYLYGNPITPSSNVLDCSLTIFRTVVDKTMVGRTAGAVTGREAAEKAKFDMLQSIIDKMRLLEGEMPPDSSSAPQGLLREHKELFEHFSALKKNLNFEVSKFRLRVSTENGIVRYYNKTEKLEYLEIERKKGPFLMGPVALVSFFYPYCSSLGSPPTAPLYSCCAGAEQGQRVD